MDGWGDCQWTEVDAFYEAVFRYWCKRSPMADMVLLDLERIRLGALAGDYDTR